MLLQLFLPLLFLLLFLLLLLLLLKHAAEPQLKAQKIFLETGLLHSVPIGSVRQASVHGTKPPYNTLAFVCSDKPWVYQSRLIAQVSHVVKFGHDGPAHLPESSEVFGEPCIVDQQLVRSLGKSLLLVVRKENLPILI